MPAVGQTVQPPNRCGPLSAIQTAYRWFDRSYQSVLLPPGYCLRWIDSLLLRLSGADTLSAHC
jgi:hypothetical protein